MAIENITTEEAAWLIKAVVNTAHDLGQPIDLGAINADYVAEKINEYRSIESHYEQMKKDTIGKKKTVQ